MIGSLVGIYAMIAAATAFYLHREDVERPIERRLFGTPERTMLLLAQLAVGALWILFTPTLAVVGLRSIRRTLASGGRPGWTLPHIRPLRVRG